MIEGVATTVVSVRRSEFAMLTLAERIQWVLEQEKFKSKRAWSLAAGRSATQVTMILRRPEQRVADDVLEDLARAANVNPEWLRSGRGEPNVIPGNMSAVLKGTGTLAAVPYTKRLEEIDLAVAIGECADSALRGALRDFYRERSDADATATVKHHLYGLDRSAERAKTEREWSDEVRAYYNRIRKGAASPFGR